MAYSHRNSRGQTYYLHTREVTLRGGRRQRIFYFARRETPAQAVDAMPPGYQVAENSRTGLPLLKKS